MSTRGCLVGWAAADNMRAENNLVALRRALALRGIGHFKNQLIHHSDRGSQYVSDDYTNLLTEHGILIRMCSDLLENAHVERANGTIKNDYLYRKNIQIESDFFRQVEHAVNNYNNRRHRSLRKTPIQFETYVKELSQSNRPKLDIFTINQSVDNPLQTKLQFKF